MDHAWLWTRFIIASAVILIAAGRLSRYADVISEKLNLGHVFVGMVFLGWVTSLPELVLSLGSTIYVGEPDLAIGNVLGSCLFNLMILVAADVVIVHGLFYTRTNPRCAVTGAASFFMLLLAACGLLLPMWLRMPAILGMDIFSLLIIVSYVGATVYLYRHDKKSGPGEEPSGPAKYESTSIVPVLIASFLATAAIVGAGLYMSVLGDEIAATYNIAHSFVGTLFFAVVSSLPELATTIAAARLGFHDMALGNIFGSNIFNIMIIGVSDIFYRQGSIITSPKTHRMPHLLVAVFALIATTALIIAVRRRSQNLFWRISWVSFVVVACYLLGLSVSYLI